MTSIVFPKEPGIYQIVCLPNGKVYIGSAKNLYIRKNQHINDLCKGKHRNIHLQNAFWKYGEDAFEFGILEFCEPSILTEREQYYIDTLNPEININPKAGSSLGKRHSEETRKKMSEQQKRRPPISEETRQKMSAAKKGKPIEEGVRFNRIGHKHPGLGGQFNNNRADQSKPVDQIDPKTGLIVASFPSQTYASKATGLKQGSISRTCSGKKKTCGGYIWRFSK